jgi:hypothetical protein
MKRFRLVAFGALAALTAVSCSDTHTMLAPESARFSSDASHTFLSGSGSAWHGYHAAAVTYDAARNPFQLCAQWNDPALFGRDAGRYVDADFFSFDFHQLTGGEGEWTRIGSANSRNKEEPACYIVGALEEGTYTFRVIGMARHGKGRETTTHHAVARQAHVVIGHVEQITFSVAIDPGLAEIDIQGSVQLTATVRDGEDNEVQSPSLIWTSDHELVAAVDGSGLVTATGGGYGNVKITATYSLGGTDYSGNAVVTVQRPPPVVSISAPADGAEFADGSPITFTGSAIDADGIALSGSALVWTSSRDGVFGTGESFAFANLSVGEHEITLSATDTHGSFARAASIAVTLVPQTGGGSENEMLSLPGFQAAWEADSQPMNTHIDGDLPAVWYETSGTFNVTAASSDGTRPIYLKTAINGLPALRFSSFSRHRYTRSLSAGIPDVVTNGLTIYAVVRNVDALTEPLIPRQTIVSQYNTGSSTSQQYWLYRHHGYGVGYVEFIIRTDSGITTLSTPLGSFPADEWVLVTARLRNGQMAVRVNSVDLGSAVRSGTIRLPGTSSLNVGSTHNGINTWGGEQAGIYLYNQGHENETVAAVEAMLMAKYGLRP